ncbi:hypothetical protein PpBr36_00759 [Pyricularia pennisetigena]|uniref:hypothetical protein n=1 Tax=Pyricularia pennisetigena TaxID=1578925 RepID=UPI00115101F8|nr:hypothetical protein PpBr36_00759 [Pyricularia pennisetigena]TLS28887.1 hypothetical protein PpBr36_00759 [Pyricularia pennisetigena]
MDLGPGVEAAGIGPVAPQLCFETGARHAPWRAFKLCRPTRGTGNITFHLNSVTARTLGTPLHWCQAANHSAPSTA